MRCILQIRNRPPFRGGIGGSRRGGGPYRGGGRGSFSHRSGSSGPPSRGRGRGRGRGGPRHFPSKGPSSKEGEEEKVEAAELANADSSQPAPPDEASTRRGPRAAYCELCNAECNSLEILEQHKKGKRHLKNLEKLGQLNNNKLSQPTDETANKEKQIPQESTSEENKVESEQKYDTVEQTLQDNNTVSTERSDSSWRRGVKRKMRGGRGGKRMKPYDMPRRSIEPPKPKVVIPLICDLCNVKCDTQEVFDRHVGGKKHISKLKRFESHQALYGPSGLQALYPPNPIAQSFIIPQAIQQQPFGGPPGPFPSGPIASQQSFDTQYEQSSQYSQGFKAAPESGSSQAAETVTAAAQWTPAMETNSGNGASQSEGNGTNPP